MFGCLVQLELEKDIWQTESCLFGYYMETVQESVFCDVAGCGRGIPSGCLLP